MIAPIEPMTLDRMEDVFERYSTADDVTRTAALQALYDLRAELRDVRAERDALRNLPVIARCHDCAHAETSPHADVCVHPAAGGRVEHGGKLPPPGNCPLRGGER